MTPTAPKGGEHVLWEGSPALLTELRDLLITHVSEGTLRVVLQQLMLREGGREAGVHEVIDAVVDVGGNLVAFPVAGSVREDQRAADRLDAALTRLRAEITEEMGAQPEGLEVIIDGDGHREVRIAFALEISPQDVAGRPAHPALHDGAHHIRHAAPALDDLRDRLIPPSPNLLRRWWDALLGGSRRGA